MSIQTVHDKTDDKTLHSFSNSKNPYFKTISFLKMCELSSYQGKARKRADPEIKFKDVCTALVKPAKMKLKAISLTNLNIQFIKYQDTFSKQKR